MTSNQKFEFTTLDPKKVANRAVAEEQKAFKSIFGSLKEDLLQSQELLRSREEAAAQAREKLVREELQAQFPLYQKAGYEEGYAKGFAAAKAEDEMLQKQLLQTLEKISAELPSMTEKLEMQLTSQLADTVSIARYIAGKVIGATPDDRFFVAIEQILAEQLPSLAEAEKLKIKIHSSHVPLLQLRLSHIANNAHFTGKCIITGSNDVAPGDCVLEWEGGVIKKSKESLLKMIDTVCEHVTHSVS